MHGLQESLRPKSYRSLIFWASAIAAVLLDQATKHWTLETIGTRSEPYLTQGIYTSISVIPRLLRFQYAENTGAAFSLFTRHPGILTLIASLLAVAVVVWAHLLPRTERLSRFALGLVFGGAVGNIIDRFRHGFVVDFIQFHWDGRPLFPTFNVADSCICVGISIFFLTTWFAPHPGKAAPAAPPAGEEKK